MRRKSERAKASPSVKQTESTPRRTTRRNRKSPEKSITEEDSDNSSEQGVNSDTEVVEATTPKRAKRPSRAEKSETIEEVKERPTRGKRKISVRSSETHDEDDVAIADLSASQPDSKAEISGGDAEKSDDRGHDNGDNARSINDSDSIVNVADADTAVAAAAATVTEEPSKPVDDADKADTTVDQPPADAASNTKTNTDDDVVAATSAVSKVIPEETGEAVGVDTTAAPESSNNHEIVFNDFSETNTAASNSSSNSHSEPVQHEDVDNKEDVVEKKAKSVAAEDDKSNGGDIKTAAESISERDGNDITDDRKDNETVAKPVVRKRKWLSSKQSIVRKDEIAISSDSLNALIPNVKPVTLNDINLETNSEPENEETGNDVDSESEEEEEVDEEEEKSITRTISLESNRRSEERVVTVITEPVSNAAGLSSARKVSIVLVENVARPPSPSKHNPSCILYITNLVRPFTAIQLRGLLARTGKIVENGFWMDKIKSKCYVKFENEEEASETRHALHGVQWPSSNPKCLNVDFGSESQMEKALESTNDEMRPAINLRDERGGHGVWDRNEGDREKPVLTERPVREWDLGKKPDNRRGRDAERDDKEHVRDNVRGVLGREADAGDRNRDRDRARRTDRDKRRHSESVSPARKFAKKDNEPPLKLLDDLFRKTKATPSIYWLPLTPEQIAVKQEARQKQLAEHQRRIDALKKQRAEREQQNRDRRRRRDSRERNSRDRGRNDRRRY